MFSFWYCTRKLPLPRSQESDPFKMANGLIWMRLSKIVLQYIYYWVRHRIYECKFVIEISIQDKNCSHFEAVSHNPSLYFGCSEANEIDTKSTQLLKACFVVSEMFKFDFFWIFIVESRKMMAALPSAEQSKNIRTRAGADPRDARSGPNPYFQELDESQAGLAPPQ